MAESFPSEPGNSGGSFPKGESLDLSETIADAGLLLFRRYRVLRELGRGGMGVVVLAYDTALDVNVAVKMVPDLLVKDTEAVADLRKEVRRGMALMNPGIVRTHNFEKDEGGAGIVMEYIEGDTLTELKVQQHSGCFNPEQILPWIEQLCAVLDYAHRDARLVHRDLKPRNIMITKAGRLKVADFGISALMSDSMSRYSMEGVVSGTLSYMSPQQAQGQKPTPLDDIHAVGATIYELLTGKPPFFRGNAVVIQSQVIGMVPPSMVERREELDIVDKPPIPAHWEATVAACLAKEAEDRPQSAGEVLARLRDTSFSAPSSMEAVTVASHAIPPALSPEPVTLPAQAAAMPPPPTPASVRPPFTDGAVPPIFRPAKAPSGSRGSFGWIAAVLAAASATAAAYYFVPWKNQPSVTAALLPVSASTAPAVAESNPAPALQPIVSRPTASPAPPVIASPVTTKLKSPSLFAETLSSGSIPSSKLAGATLAPTTPVPYTPPPPPPRPAFGSEYRGVIGVPGKTAVNIPITIKFDARTGATAPAFGVMIQQTSVGSAQVKFAGSWEGAVFYGRTGEIIKVPTRVHWEPEDFTITIGPGGRPVKYSSTSDGQTYQAELQLK